MKKICLICNYWHFPNEKTSSRYYFLANFLQNHGYDVTVVTSDFRHKDKTFRQIRNYNFNFKIVLCHEPGYKRNVSIRRIWSSSIFARNSVHFLKNSKENFDLIFCSVPTLSLGKRVSSFAKLKRIPIVIDLQDLWPEAFSIIFGNNILSKILFMPMLIKANRIYSKADGICAVSETYLSRMLSCRRKRINDFYTYAYLGNEPKLIASLNRANIQPDKSFFTIGYAGSLGNSYDLETVIKAISKIKNKKIRLFVIGDGEKKIKLVELSKELNCDVTFFGYKNFTEMMEILMKCNVTVNPISKNSVASIINKVGDYALAGRPTINSLKSDEYISLLKKYNCGITIEPNNVDEMKKAILLFANMSKREIKKMGENHLTLEDDFFNREKTYLNILDLINKLIK